MPHPTPEDEKRALEETPKGTWAILLVYAVISSAAWLFMYYGIFIARGTIH